MGNHFTILLVMDFTLWYIDIWIYVDCVSLIPECYILDHHGLRHFMAHWDFIRWLLDLVLFRVGSVIGWSVIQDEKGGQALKLRVFSFLSFLVFS